MALGHTPPRVLQFLWRLSETGGIQRVVRELLAGIDRERFDVHLCTVRPAWPEDHLDALGEGIKFHSLGVSGAPSAARRLRLSRDLARLVRSIGPDLVHVHSGTAWYLVPSMVAGRRRYRVVFDFHDAPQSRRVSPVTSHVESWMVRRPSVAPVAHSSSVASDLAQACGVPIGDVDTIPLGINTHAGVDRRAGETWRRDHGITPDETLISYVARLVPSKNVDLFLEVARQVDPRHEGLRFVIVGEGPERQRLESHALARRGRVLFTGAEARLTGVLNASDIFLSTSDYEGFGIAILEAMAAGVPVVATAVGGTTDLVVPSLTGSLAASGDAAGLSRALSELLDDAGLRRRLGEAGRARAQERFDVRTMVERYEDLYLALLGGTARGS